MAIPSDLGGSDLATTAPPPSRAAARPSAVATLLGRIASKIHAAHPLVFAQCLASGQMNNLTPAEVAAACSPFVADSAVAFREGNAFLLHGCSAALLRALEEAATVAERVHAAQQRLLPAGTAAGYECNLDASLVVPVLLWAGGSDFETAVAAGEDVFEGGLVRHLRRLNELLRQAAAVARFVMMSVDLAEKFERASAGIARGVPFAASLYFDLDAEAAGVQR